MQLPARGFFYKKPETKTIRYITVVGVGGTELRPYSLPEWREFLETNND